MYKKMKKRPIFDEGIILLLVLGVSVGLPLVSAGFDYDSPELPILSRPNLDVLNYVNYSNYNVNNSDYVDSLDSTAFCRLNYPNTNNIGIGGVNVGGYSGTGYTVNGTNTGFFEIIRSTNTANTLLGIFRAGNYNSSTLVGVGFRSGTAPNKGQIVFQTRNGTALVDGLILDENQNVNISGGLNLKGDFKLVDNGTQWDDMVIPIFATGTGNLAPTLTIFNNTNILVYAFSNAVANSEDRVYATLQMSHSYKLRSDIDCHLHWTCGTTSTNNVTWSIYYTLGDINNKFTESNIITATQPCGNSYVHNLVDFHSIGNFTGISGIANFMLLRNSSIASDTYTGNDAFALSFDCHYEKDSIGSNQEYVK